MGSNGGKLSILSPRRDKRYWREREAPGNCDLFSSRDGVGQGTDPECSGKEAWRLEGGVCEEGRSRAGPRHPLLALQ